MYGLRPQFNLTSVFGLSLSLSEITLLFDLSLYLDRTLAQRKATSKVSHSVCCQNHNICVNETNVNKLVYYVTSTL